jgi:RNA polymerase-binding transcription factor DksA
MAVESRRQALLGRLGELTGRIGQIEDELEMPHTKDLEDQAAEREGEEVLEDLGEQGRAEIAMIHAALARIEAGTYGVCVTCGDTISEERLDVIPATPYCRNCAR